MGDPPRANQPATDDAIPRNMGKTIVWYYDVISPFAYLALAGIEALARRQSLRTQPIVFGAVLAHWGQLGPAEIPPKRLHTYRQCQFLADQTGIAFCFPPRHPFRSLDMLRLLTALDSRPDVVRAVFDAVWAEGRDLGERDERDALCRQLGIDDYEALIARTDAKIRLRDGTEAAIGAGVFGVPTLAIDEELFWGLDAMPMAEAYLADPQLLAHGEMVRIQTLPTGVERRTG